jgi:hypothetical protein
MEIIPKGLTKLGVDPARELERIGAVINSTKSDKNSCEIVFTLRKNKCRYQFKADWKRASPFTKQRVGKHSFLWNGDETAEVYDFPYFETCLKFINNIGTKSASKQGEA